MQYKDLCFGAMEVVKSAAAYVRKKHEDRQGLVIEEKGRQNFVTEVDKKAEEILVSGLSELLPEAGFIAEEDGSRKREERYNWVIDPLDGTTNFIHGVPLYAISIGLLDRKEVVAAVVFEINQHECFYAWKDGGTFLNGHPVRVSDKATLSESLVATGFPYTDFSRLDSYTNVFIHLMQNTHGLRRLGSAAIDLAYVACGRFECFYEYGLNPWDVAGGSLLVTEGDGMVTDFRGADDHIFGREIVASNKLVHAEFLGLIKERFQS